MDREKVRHRLSIHVEMGLITGKLVPTLLSPKLLFVALELRHVEVSLSDPRHGRFYLLVSHELLSIAISTLEFSSILIDN